MSAETLELSVHRQGLLEHCQNCSRQPYLELPIPNDAGQILALEFTIKSRDQGWASDPNPYSCTSFDLSVNRKRGRGHLRSKRICSNKAAHARFEEHFVRWDCGSSDVITQAWIEAIEAGDILQLIPSATYEGWVNFIIEAKIRVEYRAKSRCSVENTPWPAECYSPLDSSKAEFRVLELMPSSSNTPCGRLKNVTLTDQLDFAALSYCWSDSTSSAPFLLQVGNTQHTLEVGPNVATALKHLQDRSPTLRIWIDALCINQADIEERAQQVAIMEQIFSRATQVHVWLGENKRLVATALNFVHDAYNYNKGTCKGGKDCHCTDTKHLIEVDEFSAKHGSESRTPYALGEISHWYADRLDDWKATLEDVHPAIQLMNFIFELPWFSRVWVVQEVLLASKATIHFDDTSIPWLEIVAVNQWLNRNWGNFIFHTPARTALPQIWFSSSNRSSNPEDVEGSLRLNDPNLSRGGVLDVFLSALELKATDSRDKLFAVLALTEEARRAGTFPQPLQPSYRKSATQVFVDLMRWYIKQYQSLDVLSALHCNINRAWRQTGFRSQAPKRPTWSFDVDETCHPAWARATLLEQFSFRATSDSAPEHEVDDEAGPPFVLQLKGYAVGEIRNRGYPQARYIDVFDENVQDGGIESVFHKIFDPLDDAKFWTGDLIGYNRRTLPQPSDRPNYETRFSHHAAAHWGYFERTDSQALGVTDDGQPQWTDEQHIPTCVGKCFFVTNNGYHGLCPFTAREGDTIVLLHGAKVPFILRRSGSKEENGSDHYAFIGECFVDGIMYGELFNSFKKEGKSPDTFTLI